MPFSAASLSGAFPAAAEREVTRFAGVLSELLAMQVDLGQIEQARFRNRLKIVYDLEPLMLQIAIPTPLMKSLVENAARLGISRKNGPGTVKIQASVLAIRVVIRVQEDGVEAASAPSTASSPFPSAVITARMPSKLSPGRP